MNIDVHKIKLMLAENGLTFTTFAEKCGVSRQSISTIMARGTCSPITAGKLAKGIGLTVAEITRRD